MNGNSWILDEGSQEALDVACADRRFEFCFECCWLEIVGEEKLDADEFSSDNACGETVSIGFCCSPQSGTKVDSEGQALLERSSGRSSPKIPRSLGLCAVSCHHFSPDPSWTARVVNDAVIGSYDPSLVGKGMPYVVLGLALSFLRWLVIEDSPCKRKDGEPVVAEYGLRLPPSRFGGLPYAKAPGISTPGSFNDAVRVVFKVWSLLAPSGTGSSAQSNFLDSELSRHWVETGLVE